MSISMLKMWVSMAGLLFMLIAVGFIYLSRYKLTGFFKFIFSFMAYIFMIIAGIILFFIVLTGPTNA